MQNFLPKYPFSFTLETFLKWRRKQGDVESISARVTKHASKKVAKAEFNLNYSLWIDYEQLIIDCFDCIFISTEDLAYFTSIFSVFIISLFLAAPALRVRREWNLMEISVQNEQKFFTLFGGKCYFIQKLRFSYFTTFSEMFLKLKK